MLFVARFSLLCSQKAMAKFITAALAILIALIVLYFHPIANQLY